MLAKKSALAGGTKKQAATGPDQVLRGRWTRGDQASRAYSSGSPL